MIDVRALNIVPDVLVRRGLTPPQVPAAALRNLNTVSGGYDFLLQASNAMCAETSFASMKLPWLVGRLDGQARAILQAANASFASATLQTILASGGEADVLLLFGRKDVQFDGGSACRVRADVRIAIGRFFRVPRVPVLVPGRGLRETVQQFVTEFTRLGERIDLEAARSAVLSQQSPSAGSVRSFTSDAGSAASIGSSFALSGRRAIDLVSQLDGGISILPKHFDLGDQQSFDVTSWLDGGVLEVSASIGAFGDQPSATIRVSGDVSASTPLYTGLSHDASLLLATSDPLGLLWQTTHRVRERGQLTLIDDISLVGGPAAAKPKGLSQLVPSAFPCGTGACPLTVATNIVPWHLGTPNAVRIVGTSGYGVIWSAEAVDFLVRHCWNTGRFPRSITQITPVTLTIDGNAQVASAESQIVLDTLDTVAIEYDSNGRGDVLHTGGSARVVPKLIHLDDGRELLPQDANDPVFAPGDPRPWNAIGELSENPLPSPSPDIAQFERSVTLGTMSRLGRPFAEPVDRTVIYSRVSAPSQRVLLIAE